MKKKFKAVALVVISFFLLNISGCNSVPLYAKAGKYSPPSPPGPNEILLYVFREDTIVGGAVGLTFVADDTVVGALDFGSFTYAKLPAKEYYEVVAVMNENFDEPKYHYRISASSGETAYVMWNNSLGERGFGVHSIDKSYAVKFIKDYDYRELKIKYEKIGVSYNEYFDKLITGDKNLPVIDSDKIIENRPLYKKDDDY